MKAQAAIEFLTTYGWVFIIILIMMGALAYFGILNPSGLLPDRCTFSSELSCLDWKISITDDRVVLRLVNNMEDNIIIDNGFGEGFWVYNEKTLSLCDQPLNIGPSNPWSSKESRNFIIPDCNLPLDNKLNVRISYYKVKSGLPYKHEVYGEIFARVEDSTSSLSPPPASPMPDLFLEAENLSLSSGFVSTANCGCSFPSDGMCARHEGVVGSEGFMTLTNFILESGNYDVVVRYCDENDEPIGNPDDYRLLIDGVEVYTWISSEANSASEWIEETTTATINNGDIVEIGATCSQSASWCRTDWISFVKII